MDKVENESVVFPSAPVNTPPPRPVASLSANTLFVTASDPNGPLWSTPPPFVDRFARKVVRSIEPPLTFSTSAPPAPNTTCPGAELAPSATLPRNEQRRRVGEPKSSAAPPPLRPAAFSSNVQPSTRAGTPSA